jgi:hypothetical protein
MPHCLPNIPHPRTPSPRCRWHPRRRRPRPWASRRAARLPRGLAAKTVTIVWIWACVNPRTLSVKCPEMSDSKGANPHSKKMLVKKLDD